MGCFRAFMNTFHLKTAKNTSIQLYNVKKSYGKFPVYLAVFTTIFPYFFHMKNIKRTINLDLAKYANIETGELMLDILDEDTSIKVLKDTGLVLIDSKDYFITDVQVLTDLLENGILKPKDLGYIMVMSQTLRSEYNAIYKQAVPHTLESLSELLGISYDHTMRLVKGFCRKNIMYRLVTATDTVYCINPYLTRKRKTLSKELTTLFNKFGKQPKKVKAKK